MLRPAAGRGLPRANTADAIWQDAPLIDRPVAAAELAGLRRLQRAAVHAAAAILAGEPLDCGEINALAAESTARTELVVTAGLPRRRLVWTDPSLAATLARRLIEELDALAVRHLGLRGAAGAVPRPRCD